MLHPSMTRAERLGSFFPAWKPLWSLCRYNKETWSIMIWLRYALFGVFCRAIRVELASGPAATTRGTGKLEWIGRSGMRDPTMEFYRLTRRGWLIDCMQPNCQRPRGRSPRTGRRRVRCTDESQVPSVVMTSGGGVHLGARRERASHRLPQSTVTSIRVAQFVARPLVAGSSISLLI
jgi:hypothetical protein